MFLSACSPSSFFGGKGKNFLQPASYRRINSACSLPEFSAPTFKAEHLKSLLRCLNAYGGVDPLVALVEGVEDADLEPLAELFNTTFLQDPTLVYQIEQTHKEVAQKQKWKPLFTQMGRFLEQTPFILSLIDVLNHSRIRSPEGRAVVDPALLKVLEILAHSFSDDHLAEAIDFGKTFAGAPVLQSWQSHFGLHPSSLHTLEQLVQSFHAFLGEEHTFECGGARVPFRPLVVQAVLENDGEALGKALGDLLAGDIRHKIPRLSSIFQTTLTRQPDGSTLLGGFADAVAAFNTSIPCMRGGVSIPNAAMHILREISEAPSEDVETYALWTNPLNLSLLAPFCQFPARTDEHYRVLKQTALTGVMPAMADLVKAVYKKQGRGLKWRGCDGRGPEGAEYPLLAHLFITALADRGGTAGTGGFKRLLPLLEEFAARDAWMDSALLLALPTEVDRQRVYRGLKFALVPQSGLGGESVSEVLTRVATRLPVSALYSLAQGFAPFFADEEVLLDPLLTSVREIFYVNNVHPFTRVTRDLFAQASSRPDLFNSLARISEKQHLLRPAIVHVAEMAKDGRLEELMDAMVKIFHSLAERGKAPGTVIAAAEPPFRVRRSHDLRTLPPVVLHPVRMGSEVPLAARASLPPATYYDWYNADCRDLNPAFSWADLADPNYEAQLNRLLRCRGDDSYLQAASFLRDPTHSSDGISYWNHIVQFHETLFAPLTEADNRFLVEAWIRAYHHGPNGTFFPLLDLIPPLVNGVAPATPTEAATPVPVVEPLAKSTLQLLGEVIRLPGLQDSIVRLESFAGQWIRRADVPDLVRDLLNWDRQVEAGAAAVEAQPHWFTSDLLTKTAEWVRTRECHVPRTEDEVRARVQAIIQEAQTNITNWDLETRNPARRGRPRSAWTAEELFQDLNPLLAMTEGPQGDAILDAQLAFFRFFSLPEGQAPNPEQQATPRVLLRWLHSRSQDFRLVTYFYPGEATPRVRLLNTLDLLELVLINADLDDHLPGLARSGLSLTFLTELALAWGDVPFELRPTGIQTLYPPGGPEPKTLLQAVHRIIERRNRFTPELEDLDALSHRFFGLPPLPGCFTAAFPDVPQPRAGRFAGVTGSVGANVSEIQRGLWNIHQVVSVLLENAVPTTVGAGDWMQRFPNMPNGMRPHRVTRFGVANDPMAVVPGTGLEVMRNLFWVFYESTPPANRGSTSEQNHLRIVLKAARMGAMHQMGKLLQDVQRPVDMSVTTDPRVVQWRTIEDFFAVVVHSASAPEMRGALRGLSGFPEGNAFLRKLIREILSLPAADLDQLRQTVFYSLALLNRLEPGNPNPLPDNHVLRLLTGVLSTLLNSENGRFAEFLGAEDNGVLGRLLKVRAIAPWVQAAYESFDGSPGGDDLRTRWLGITRDFLPSPTAAAGPFALPVVDALRVFHGAAPRAGAFVASLSPFIDSPPVQAIKNRRFVHMLGEFLATPSGEAAPGVNPAQATQHLRDGLAQILEDPTRLNHILLLMGDATPDGVVRADAFYEQVVRTVGSVVGTTDSSPLRSFLRKFVVPGLSERPFER